MKIRLAILLPGLLFAVAALAQHARQQPQAQAETRPQDVKSPQSLPTVEQILDRYAQAIGGPAAWGKLTNRSMKMTLEIQDSKVTVNVENYAQAPIKHVFIGQVKVSGAIAFEVSRGFNGKVGWSLNASEGGFRELDGIELAKEKREAEFYRELKLKELYPKMALIGQVKVNDHMTYCIEANPTEGCPEKWYFDIQTGLLVRVDSFSEGSCKGGAPEEAYYEDYREVDGVKLPFSIRSPGSKIVYKVQEVRHNVPIDEAKFKSPGSAFEALSTFKSRRSGQPPAERGVLYLSLEPAGDQISVQAELDGDRKSYRVPHGAEMARELRALYMLLQGGESTETELNPLLKKFGAIFFTPIAAMLGAAAEIRFVIPGKFLIFPLDLLHFKGRSLFLQKPVSYSFERMTAGQFLFSPEWKALIISDKTSDPENGCQLLKEMLPASGYYAIEDMNLAKLATIQTPDLLLISAHGSVGYGNVDGMAMGEERLLSESFSHLSPELVYLDSCALGASASFIQGFRERGTRFYLAPIVSNEAGNSSTKTIAFFFERLRGGDTPSQALFYTRRKLYETYREKDGFAKLLFRAFPFRVYLLN